MKNKKGYILFLLMALMLVLGGCLKNDGENETESNDSKRVPTTLNWTVPSTVNINSTVTFNGTYTGTSIVKMTRQVMGFEEQKIEMQTNGTFKFLVTFGANPGNRTIIVRGYDYRNVVIISKTNIVEVKNGTNERRIDFTIPLAVYTDKTTTFSGTYSGSGITKITRQVDSNAPQNARILPNNKFEFDIGFGANPGNRTIVVKAYNQAGTVVLAEKSKVVNVIKNTSPVGDLNGLKVAIDVGHGRFYDSRRGTGFDCGATNSRLGLNEWDYNKKQAELVAAALRARGATVNIFIYPNQTGVSYLNLDQKGRKSRDHDLFVSIHQNSFNTNAQGTEDWIQSSNRSNDRKFADKVVKKMVNKIWNGNSSMDRGIKVGGRANGVLSGAVVYAKAALLTESFFLDNRNLTIAQVNANIEKGAKGIAEGVADYWLSR